MPIFSIIIPVYNTQDYVSDCLKSVLSQTFSDFECIIINDGSTDDSDIICNDIGKQDNRFIIIHQQNSGISISRNKGIIYSNGDYIIFLDSDDVLINIYALQKLYEVIKKQNFPDVIYHSHLYSFSDEQYFINYDSINLNILSYNVSSFFNVFTHSKSNALLTSWTFTINKKFFINNNLFFKDHILHEDNHFIPRLLCSIDNQIAINHNLFYGYRKIRHGSIMHSINSKRITDLIVTINELIQISNNELIKYKKKIYHHYCNSLWLYAFRLLSEYDEIEDNYKKQTVINSLISTSNCILYKINLLNIIYYFCFKLFGINNTINIRNFIKKFI